MKKLSELLAERSALVEKRNTVLTTIKAIADKDDAQTTAEEKAAFTQGLKDADDLVGEITKADSAIEQRKELDRQLAMTAQPAAGQSVEKVNATVETDRYVKDKSLVIGGVVKMIGRGGGDVMNAKKYAEFLYGENHPVTKALVVSSGSAGGFIVPPDQMTEIIELLRPKARVRALKGLRNIPMPRGTMTIPGQGSAAVAGYGPEVGRIASSQQGLNQIVASYKKLTALVPVSNDMMRYADPAVDAFVRDDLIKVIALREDLAFIMGDGTQDAPRGFISFANGYAVTGGGTAGVWKVGAASTLAAGGNFISSTSSFSLATVAAELGGAVNKLDTANVPEDSRAWLMHPRSFNYLFNVQNSLGVYVYRDELSRGTLLGYPVWKTTQIPTNISDASNSNTDLSFVFLVEATEAMILDSMQLELAVSREGSYVDASTGSTISAFQNDQTLIRAIEEHDFQLRHDASVAVIQGVRWAPAIS